MDWLVLNRLWVEWWLEVWFGPQPHEVIRVDFTRKRVLERTSA
jgi:hypothetical protein